MSDFTQLKAIAFDLDGTLLDSVPDLAAAVRGLLEELSLPACTDEQVRGWIGNGVKVLVQRALAFATDSTVADEALLASSLPRFNHFYQLHLQKHSQLYADVKTVLQQLHKAGYRLAVVTNKPIKFTTPLLKFFGIENYFTMVLGGDSLERMKPDPLPLQHIMQQWGLSHSELMMVGDSKNDILAAKAAGICSIGLTYGYNYGEDIGLSGPTAVCEKFNEISALLNLGPKVTE